MEEKLELCRIASLSATTSRCKSDFSSALRSFKPLVIRRRRHLLSDFAQYFSAANQSIGPTKNAMPMKNNPIPNKRPFSLSMPLRSRTTPPRMQSMNDVTGPIRAKVFIVVYWVNG